MYSRLILISLCCISLYFIACSSLTLTTDNITSYNNGIAIIQSEQEKSKIQMEIAQEVVGGFDNVPLILYIIVENLHDKVLHFSPDNISILLNEKPIKPYSFQALSRLSFNLTQALYDYGIEQTPPNYKINDPFFSARAYRLYPTPLLFDNGFFVYRFYDYSFARANFYDAQMESYNARKFLIAHYLRKNTLHKNDVKGGFILIPYSNLQAGNMHIRVNVGNDVYEFVLHLSKQKS